MKFFRKLKSLSDFNSEWKWEIGRRDFGVRMKVVPFILSLPASCPIFYRGTVIWSRIRNWSNFQKRISKLTHSFDSHRVIGNETKETKYLPVVHTKLIHKHHKVSFKIFFFLCSKLQIDNFSKAFSRRFLVLCWVAAGTRSKAKRRRNYNFHS